MFAFNKTQKYRHTFKKLFCDIDVGLLPCTDGLGSLLQKLNFRGVRHKFEILRLWYPPFSGLPVGKGINAFPILKIARCKIKLLFYFIFV